MTAGMVELNMGRGSALTTSNLINDAVSLDFLSRN